jgi:hypothetical protein
VIERKSTFREEEAHYEQPGANFGVSGWGLSACYTHSKIS